MSQEYRKDIDGLRSFAVLIVIFFHLEISLFQGGFVGVDIFFVISGYLITKILYKEFQQNNTINFKNFYFRRLKRLMPALVVTLVISFIASIVIFIPPYNINSIQSGIYAIFGLSNISFWMDSGYFDSSKYLKPLLHTWSLGVEEQFYLVWPFLLSLFFVRLKYIVYFLLAIFLISLGLNLLFLDKTFLSKVAASDLEFWSYERLQSMAFYMMPLRAFEFVVGASLVFCNKNLNNTIQNFLSFIGLSLIGYMALMLEPSDLFPHINALIVCLGAVLIIVSKNSLFNQYILANKFNVFIGKISYSLYLIHWPLIVFYFYLVKDIQYIDKLVILVLTIILSTLMYKFVEQRFRYYDFEEKRSKIVFKYLAVIGIVATLFLSGLLTNGFKTLFNKDEVVIDNIIAQKPNLSEEAISMIRTIKDDTDFSVTNKRNILIVGDSMANDLNLALSLYNQTQNSLDIRIIGLSHKCQFMIEDRAKLDYYKKKQDLAIHCNDSVDKVFEYKSLFQNADSILIVHNWYPFVTKEGLQKALERVRTITQSPIYIIGKRGEMTRGVSEAITDVLYKYNNINTFNEFLYTQYSGSMDNEIHKIVEEVNLNDVHYISMKDIQCDESTQKCFGLNEEYTLLYRDTIHWTIPGAEFFMNRILKHQKLKKAILGKENE